METFFGVILLGFGIGVRSCRLELGTSNSVVNLEYGDYFQIACNAECFHSNDVIHLRWYGNNGQRITNVPSRVFAISNNEGKGSVLLLRNVRADDTGRYTCVGEKKSKTTTQSVNVIVIEKSLSSLLEEDESTSLVWDDAVVERSRPDRSLREILLRREKRDVGSGTPHISIPSSDSSFTSLTNNNTSSIPTTTGKTTISRNEITTDTANSNSQRIPYDTGNPTISRNEITTDRANSNYRNIPYDTGKITISRNEITTDTANSNSRNIPYDTGKITISRNEITTDTANSNSRNIPSYTGKTTISRNEITTDTANSNSRRIPYDTGKITISRNEITTDTANSNSRRIPYDTGKITISRNEITTDKATSNSRSIPTTTGKTTISRNEITTDTSNSNSRRIPYDTGKTTISRNKITTDTANSNTRSTPTTTGKTKFSPKPTETAFGRYGILALSLSLSLAFLLLYALILVLILPRCCKNRTKKHDLHKDKSSTKNSNAEFLALKPLETSDDQGFTTIDLDAPTGGEQGGGSGGGSYSSESEENKLKADPGSPSEETHANEEQKKFVTTFLIGRSLSNPDGDSSKGNGSVYIHEPLSGTANLTTDLDQPEPTHTEVADTKDTSKVNTDSDPQTVKEPSKEVSNVDMVSDHRPANADSKDVTKVNTGGDSQTETSDTKVELKEPINGGPGIAKELESSSQPTTEATKPTDASGDDVKGTNPPILDTQQTQLAADDTKQTNSPENDMKEIKPLADDTKTADTPVMESASSSLFAPETNDSKLGSLADEFAKCLAMTNADENLDGLETNNLLDTDLKTSEAK